MAVRRPGASACQEVFQKKSLGGKFDSGKDRFPGKFLISSAYSLYSGGLCNFFID
jgi:hypothetical protein